MASLFNLSVKLSAEDEAVFQTLQASALLPTLATPGEGELVQLYKQKQKEAERQTIEPYADILETQLLGYLTERKDEILQKLKDSESTSFSADLFSWNSVTYHESFSELKRRQSAMTPEELRQHRCDMWEQKERIKEEGWETTFGVERQECYDGEEIIYWVLDRVKVDRIFRNSDLELRLSLALGPNFFPFTKSQSVCDDDESFSVFKKTLCVRYCPFGVTKPQMDKLLACAKNEAKRKAEGLKTSLRRDEYGVGHAQLNIWPQVFLVSSDDEYADMPPLISASAAKQANTHHCFCGCGDERE